jgi:hypothetical protein
MAHLAPNRISRHQTLWTLAAVAAAAAASLGRPLIGAPLTVGVIVYSLIRLSKPDKILRGQILSPLQHRRAAAIIGGVMLAVASLYSGALAGLELAASHEHRLHEQIEAALGAGAMRVGETFEACERFLCTRATVTQLATKNTLGLAKLSGFAMHDETAFGWRNSTARTSNRADFQQ